MELKVGEKYLTITLLGGAIRVNAFQNQKKASDNDPLFVGNGVAVWVNTKKPKPTPEVFDDVNGNLL